MKRTCLLSVLLFVAIIGQLFGMENNIALNKKYTMSKNPNYKLCTDSGDAMQITDGKYASKTMWVDKATVGWFHKSPVDITIDLGKKENIGGAFLSTAGGTSGVELPDYVFAFVSNDGKVWQYAGELEGPSSSRKGYGTCKYGLSGLKVEGRYVRLEVHSETAYIFVDEIEVFGSFSDAIPAFPENLNIRDTVKFSRELIKTKKAGMLSGNNLARNKKYTYSRKPNYWNCSDKNDIVQLTDGKYTKGVFWIQASTVGWSHCSPVDITIDLEKSEPVSGITFNSAAGRAQVHFPDLINVYVSDDGKTWDYVCDMIADGAKHGTPSNTHYNVFKFTVNDLSVIGRYVKFYLISETQYMFCDEIEIHRGSDGIKNKPLKSGIIDAQLHSLAVYFNNKIKARCRADLAEMKKTFAQLSENDIKAAEKAEKELLDKIAAMQPMDNVYDFMAYIPLNDVHAEIFSLNRYSLQKAGYSRPFFWHGNRWDDLSITEIPPEKEMSSLSIEMMRGEVRADAVNICNPTDKPISYAVSVKGLPENSNVVLKEVLYTDSRENKTVASALNPAAANASLVTVVPAGCNRQIWISIERPGAAAGDYSAEIIAVAEKQPELRASLNLKIHDIDFPKEPVLNVGGWDYCHKWDGEELKANLEIMKDIYVDSPWADYRIAPGGSKYDKDGNLLNPDKLDFRAWDKWQKNWPDARNYCLFWGGWNSFGGFHRSTPQFQTAVRDYIKAWAERIRKLGADPKNLVLLVFDEPREPQHYECTIQWAKAVKSANMGIRIYTNPIPKNCREIPPEMMKYIDIYCPNHYGIIKGSVDLSYIRQHQKKDSIFWLYSCDGPAKFLDPVAYHRAQAWRAFAMDAKASFFWQFGSCGASRHNLWPYIQSSLDYSPYFWNGKTMMHGKHSEAIRESVQDYEYLVMLGKKIASSDSKTAARLQKISDEAVERVISMISKDAFTWANDKDRRVVDDSAVKILRALK